MEVDQAYKSKEEEVQYYKALCSRLQQEVANAEHELEEFQENSKQLEKELETSLDHSEKSNRELKTTNNRLKLEYEILREKFELLQKQSSSQILELEQEKSESFNHNQELLKYIREIEQKNDDLERAQRAMFASVSEFEAKLNSEIERNALLESDKDESMAMVQRLKDEARDLKQEIKNRERMHPDNDKTVERIFGTIDSNKIKVEMETQTGTTSETALKLANENIPLATPTRISAMNILSDLLRKVGNLESKLASCRNMSRDTPQIGGSPGRDAYRGRRLNRGTSTPSIHNYSRV